MKVAQITIPECGVFSFPLPLPEGQSTDIGVTVAGKTFEARKITDRLLRVLGNGAPGVADVEVIDGGAVAEYHAIEVALTIDGIDPFVMRGARSTVIDTGGLRYTLLLDWYDYAVTGTLEIANAEWASGEHQGPVRVPAVSVTEVGGQGFTLTEGTEGGLNPREHITRRFVLCAEGHFGGYSDLMDGEHLIHCRGDWSYETIGAWGPQEITVSDLDEVPPVMELAATTVGGESPLRAVGYKDGNEPGGFLIEYSYRPGLAGQELAKLLDLSDAMMERETIWTYRDGKPLDAESAAEAYGGEIPFRVEPTNLPGHMIPCYESENWKPDHAPEVRHGWKAHDGQHFVRVTALLKSAIWNCGDQYAIHCMAQVAAHASMCKSHMPHRDVGWGHGGTVYDMLNRTPDRGENLGIGVGKREDAWLAEAILMQDRLSPGGYAGRWLSEYATVIHDNILPTGVGVQKGNNVVEERAIAGQAAPGHEPIVPGMGVVQTFEAEHFAHFMYCMSLTPGLELVGRYVVNCSKLIGGAHVPMGNEGRKGPYAYLNVADPNGKLVDPIFASSGKAESPFENWYGMGLHAYAAMLHQDGPHFGFLHELYGGGDVDASLPVTSNMNHLDRMQAMLMALDPPAPVVVDPDPDPVVDWEARYDALLVRSRSIIEAQQRTIEELSRLEPVMRSFEVLASVASDLEEQIAHNAGRISDIALGWQANPAPTQEMANGMRSMAAYLETTADLVESGLEPPPVDPVDWPERETEGLTHWDAAGNYAVDIRDQTVDGHGGTYSGAKSAVAIIRGSGTLKNCKLTQSGGDGIKVLNGSNGATIDAAHIYGIGHKPGAHADGIQITGGVSNLTIRNLVADLPIGDTSPGASPVVTSCLIISSQDAPNGRIDVLGGKLYGGGVTVYNRERNGNQIADLHFYGTEFHVSALSPQHALFSCDVRPTFHGECVVIDHATGEVLSMDPWSWTR